MATKVYANAKFTLRADTLANWEAKNPILEKGEPAVVTDGTESEKIKFGDGITRWKNLPYFKGPKGERGLPGNGSVIDCDVNSIKILAGVIRKQSDGNWGFIIDDLHTGKINCTGVRATTGEKESLLITYPQMSKVISFIAVPDETFASYGYTCGVSVSTGSTNLYIYKTVPLGCAGLLECNSYGFRIRDYSTGINSVEWDATNARLKVNHDVMTTPEAPGDNSVWLSSNISVLPYKNGKFIPVVGPAADHFTIDFYDLNGEKITELSTALSCSISRTSSFAFKKKLLSPTTDINAAGNFWFMGIFEE